jgi:hypothetical protein
MRKALWLSLGDSASAPVTVGWKVSTGENYGGHPLRVGERFKRVRFPRSWLAGMSTVKLLSSTLKKLSRTAEQGKGLFFDDSGIDLRFSLRHFVFLLLFVVAAINASLLPFPVHLEPRSGTSSRDFGLQSIRLFIACEVNLDPRRYSVIVFVFISNCSCGI